MDDSFAPNSTNDFKPADAGSMVRVVAGMLLVAVALALGSWLVFSVIGLLQAESLPPLVKLLQPKEPIQMAMPQGKVNFPAELFAMSGYAVVCVVYAIVASLTGHLLKGGVSLLQPEQNDLLRRLVTRLEKK